MKFEEIRASDVFGDTAFNRAVNSTGMLDIRRPNKRSPDICESYTCSGVRISDEYILTAHHCVQVEGQSPASAMAFTPNYNNIQQSYRANRIAVDPNPVDWDETEDWAILRVTNEDDKVAATVARLAPNTAKSGDRLSLIHHPNSDAKMLTQFNCRYNSGEAASGFSDELNQGFLHSCWAQPGSSGAPVFDSVFQLVGIHTERVQSNGVFRGISLARISEKSDYFRQVFLSSTEREKPVSMISEPVPDLEPEWVEHTVYEATGVGPDAHCSRDCGDHYGTPWTLTYELEDTQHERITDVSCECVGGECGYDQIGPSGPTRIERLGTEARCRIVARSRPAVWSIRVSTEHRAWEKKTGFIYLGSYQGGEWVQTSLNGIDSLEPGQLAGKSFAVGGTLIDVNLRANPGINAELKGPIYAGTPVSIIGPVRVSGNLVWAEVEATVKLDRTIS